MKRLCVGIIVAIGLTLPAFGQGASLKEQLVGAWALASCNNAPWCVNPNGIQIFDASGHYTVLHTAGGRPKARSPLTPRDAIPAEEYKAVAMGVQANFGTWSVNEADKTITYHIEGALFPNVEGTDFKSTAISLSGDELKMGTLVWRRIKK
jgi:Lipocalin-like domain